MKDPFYAAPLGADDPLLPAVSRFVAAHRHVGPWVVMRRFSMGRKRATVLLGALCWMRIVWASGRLYRVNPHAWGELVGNQYGPLPVREVSL